MDNIQTDDHHKSIFSLDGKVALVVGGYGAIGKSISAEFAAAGAAVIVAGRRKDMAEAFAGTLQRAGGQVDAIELDANDADMIADRVDFLCAHAGRIDILVNCVGRQIEQPVFDVSAEALLDVLSSTLRPAMLLTQAVARRQYAQNATGSHIHLLSLRSLAALRGRGYSSFTAAKGAHRNLVKQLAVELADYGIRVNGLAPGAVLTEKNSRLLREPTAWEKAIDRIPLRRLATPLDVARAGLFLACDASEFITGQVIAVDGGQSAHL